jgi:hypothetical protein
MPAAPIAIDPTPPEGEPMPHPDNLPRPEDLLVLTPQEVAAFPAPMLAELQSRTEDLLRRAKAIKARLDGALVLRYADRAEALRREAGRDAGTVRFEDGGITVVADLPKRVDWDQARLAAMVARIRAAGDDPAEYVETSLKVAERKYAAWPAAIREGFEPARTVRPGPLSVSLLAGGEGAA